MSTPLRAVRTAQSFAPTAPKFAAPSRSLHITGSNAQPSSALAFQTRMAELRKTGERPAPKPAARPFNTTRALAKPNDSSPIDFVYMPSMAPDRSSDPNLDIGLVPIVPDNTSSSRASDPLLVSTDPIVRPEISTSSMASEATVAAMSEAESGSQADSIGLVVESVKGEAEGVRRVWEGFVDDLLGPKRGAVA